MIQLRDIRYRYPRSGWVLNGVDCTISQGEYVFVCGASGSGKSTLSYLLNGLVPHFFGGTLHGSVSVAEVDTRQSSISELFSQVGHVQQNPEAQLFSSTVENEIAFGIESLGLPGREINRRIRDIAETLHIEHLLHRNTVSLSGGEKRLVAIASVLSLNPVVLVVDEPYADLDWEAMSRVRRILWETHQRGKTVIVIEQRVGTFLQDSTRCLILGRGEVVFDGPSDAAYGSIIREQLLPRYRRRDRSGSPGKNPLLVAKDLSYSVAGTEILKGVTVQLRRGENVAIVGRNGSGKTTLIKHFNGILRPTGGRVTFQGEGISGKTPAETAARVGLSFQNPNNQFFKNTVRDEILVGPRLLKKQPGPWLEEIYDLFDLRGLLDRPPYRLSEGEKKRVALASILSMSPRLLVLDEPTAGQDGHFREALATLLNQLKDFGLTTIIVTHDTDFALATTDRWIVLHSGTVVADGPPDDLLRAEHLINLGALPRPDGDEIPVQHEPGAGDSP